MSKTAIINIVGLTKQLIGEHTPFLTEWSTKKKVSTIEPMLPAVTCSVQTTYLTGKWPNEHGIIGNGWFHRNLNEIKFWHQSNALVKSKYLWDELKDKNPEFVCANMFWWFNMYSSADISVTPRPQYRVDGLKVPDCYSEPSSLREKLQKELGQFPLFDFWGPKTSIKSSQWIADASLKVHDWTNPNLMLIYLPHLDYCLQKYGPNSGHICNELRSIDNVCKHLIEKLEKKNINVSVVSEYGITETSEPIHINRILRKLDYITVRTENRKELLDPGASKAFAVSDHQIAHIYIKDKNNIQKSKKG